MSLLGAISFSIPCQNSTTIGDCISGIYSWSLVVVGVVAFVQIIYAGWIYLTAAGNTSKTGEAMSKISNAILGLVLLFSSYLILNTINPDLVGGGVTLPNLKDNNVQRVNYNNNNQLPISFTITTDSLPDGKVGQNYSQTLQVTGGQGPYSWSIPIPSSPLPDGLNLIANGAISGKPTAAGSFNFIIKVEDSSSSKLSLAKELSIKIANPSQ